MQYMLKEGYVTFRQIDIHGLSKGTNIGCNQWCNFTLKLQLDP